MERINANTEATTQNGTHRKLMAGARRDGPRAPADRAQRDARRQGRELRLLRDGLPARLQALGDEDVAAGRVGRRARGRWWGATRRGSWSPMAARPGWRRASRSADGSITGVDGRGARSSWSPAARSSHRRCCCARGIGGPAVGKNLRLHPAYVVMGVYDEPIEGWSGQIQSLVSDAYEALEGEYGFLIEATGMFPGLISAIFPWTDGATHKQLMQTLPLAGAVHHGGARPRLGRGGARRPGARGGALGADDEVDRRLAQRANVELCRLHQAAGAVEIFTAHAAELRWRPGDDFEAFVERVDAGAPTTRTTWPASRRTRWGRAGWARTRRRRWRTAAASCTTSKGVWIGDASRVPDGAGRQPDDLDHVAGAPDGGGETAGRCSPNGADGRGRGSLGASSAFGHLERTWDVPRLRSPLSPLRGRRVSCESTFGRAGLPICRRTQP